MKRRVFGVFAVAAGVLVCGALAAPFGISTATLSGGNVTVSACDANGFVVTYTTSHGSVTAVTVSGIADPACEGGTLKATITNSAGSILATVGPATVPADGDTADDSLTLATSAQPAASLVAGTEVVVEGP